MIPSFAFDPELEKEINQFTVTEVEANTLLLKEDSFIKVIPLVLEGSIKVFRMDETGKEIILYRIIPGESCILSITYCLNDKESKARAVTENKTRLIAIPSEQVKQWMDRYPSWRKFVTRLYHARLDELLSLVDNIAFRQVDTRLIQKLNDLAAIHDNTISITHQTLANEIGTAREVVSRLLKHLEIQGYVQLDRGNIQILKPLKF